MLFLAPSLYACLHAGLDGFVKVVDFGFAKAVPYMHKNGQMQYRTFTLCGTPDYMGQFR